MRAAPDSLFTPSQLQARACQWVGISLIGLFLVNLLGSFLPPKLLDPDWQLSLVANLIDNGGYPLLGLLLTSLGGFIDPDNAPLQKRQLQWRSLACWVSVGYLLLIPLIGLACQRGLTRASIALQQETRTARNAINTMRGAIQQAQTFPDLQLRFRQLQAPALPPDTASIPLADLKSELLDRLQIDENALKANQEQPLFSRFLPILQKAFRNMLGCVVLGVGFSAVALPRGRSRSQLQDWASSLQGLMHPWDGLLRLWRGWRQAGRERRELAQRMDNLRRAQLQAERNMKRSAARETPRKSWSWLGNRRRRVSPKTDEIDYLRQISSSREDNDRQG